MTSAWGDGHDLSKAHYDGNDDDDDNVDIGLVNGQSHPSPSEQVIILSLIK